MVSINQTDKQFSKTVNSYNIPHEIESDPIFELSKGRGRTVLSDGKMILRLAGYPESAEDYGLLQHEIFHVAELGLHDLGMKLTMDSDEAYAYTIQFLTRKIYKLLKFK